MWIAASIALLARTLLSAQINLNETITARNTAAKRQPPPACIGEHSQRIASHFPCAVCKFWQNFNALFNLQNGSRVSLSRRQSARHTQHRLGGSAASVARQRRHAQSAYAQPTGQTSKSTTMHTASEHSHDTCALHAHSLTLCLVYALPRIRSLGERNWTKPVQAPRLRSLSLSLSRATLSLLPAYTKICSEQFSLKSSLAEFTSHLSRPARHAAVAQTNNTYSTVEVEVEVEAAVDAWTQQQQTQIAQEGKENLPLVPPRHTCVARSVSVFVRACVRVFLVAVACPVSRFCVFSARFVYVYVFFASPCRARVCVSFNCFCARNWPQKLKKLK